MKRITNDKERVWSNHIGEVFAPNVGQGYLEYEVIADLGMARIACRRVLDGKELVFPADVVASALDYKR